MKELHDIYVFSFYFVFVYGVISMVLAAIHVFQYVVKNSEKIRYERAVMSRRGRELDALLTRVESGDDEAAVELIKLLRRGRHAIFQ